MQIITCPPYEQAVLLALARLTSSGVIAYPTDTIYGLGCDALDSKAIRKIMEIKKRDGQKPLSVIFSDWNAASEYVKIDEGLKQKLEKLTPGPYTFLLPLRKKIPVTPDAVLGCRIPDNEFCRCICAEFENPIVSTSANVSGARSPASALEIDEAVLKSVDLIVDGGVSKYKEGSTVIDVEGKTILRRGAGADKAQKWIENL